MRRSIFILMALALVLAACSPGDSEATTTTGGDDDTTTTAGADDTTTTGASEATTTTEAPSSEGSSCVEGTWLFGTDVFIEAMQQVAATEGGLGDIEITPAEGTYTVTLDGNGTFSGVRDDWGFSVSASDGTFSVRINGSEEGTWSADDNTITVTIDSSDVTVNTTAEVDGQTITLPESPVEVPDAIAEQSNYTCDGDSLTVISDGIEFTLMRA